MVVIVILAKPQYPRHIFSDSRSTVFKLPIISYILMLHRTWFLLTHGFIRTQSTPFRSYILLSFTSHKPTLRAVPKYILKVKILGMVYLLCLSLPSLERGVRSNAFTSRWNDLIWLHPYSHQSPLSRKWNIKKHTVAEFCDPSWLFHRCYTPHCTLRARYFKAPSSPGISPPSRVLPSYGPLSQKIPYHFSHSCSTIPLMNTLEISFILVRQDKIEASPRGNK